MSIDDNSIRERFQAMATGELRGVITSEREDYVPRALALAEEELARREATAREGEDPIEEEAEVAAPVPRGTGRGSDVWLSLVAVGAVGGVFAAVVTGSSASSIFVRVLLAIIAGSTFVY